MFASSALELSRLWTGKLAHYRTHSNKEHLEALFAEAVRYTGFHLEDELSLSPYWSKAPLTRRVALLLYTVDRGMVARVIRDGRITFEASGEASAWAIAEPSLRSYLVPTLEFLAALQADRARRDQARQRRPRGF